MPGTQTTLDADAFGTDLQHRIDRAEDVRERVVELLEREYAAGESSWHPPILDEAYDLATSAISKAHTEEAEETIDLAEMLVEDADEYLRKHRELIERGGEKR